MRLRRRVQAGVLLCALGLAGLLHFKPAVAMAQNDKAQIAQRAVALLQARCLRCHGQDKTSGLDLRSRDTLLQGGSRGAAIVVGKAEQSLLYQFISGNLQPRMPVGEELSTAEIALLKQWIDAEQNGLTLSKLSKRVTTKLNDRIYTRADRSLMRSATIGLFADQFGRLFRWSKT